jgi:hypothetical protein
MNSAHSRPFRLPHCFPVLLWLIPGFFAPRAIAQNSPPTTLPDSPKPHLLRDVPNYRPLTGAARARWVVVSTFGPESLMAGGFTAAWGTAFNFPEEYGPHWDGFAKRYGMRFTGVAASNTMEAGLGALWGEDPDYFPSPDRGFGSRVRHIFWMSVMAPRRNGHLEPAYARLIAYPASNFLSNTWRVSSEATTGHALARTGYAFLGKIGSNAFAEFWPSLRRAVFRR